MSKSLLVTLADKNYIDQAKQLFSSVYHNAGWKGDYMLLAHEIPESKLKWFRKKDIIVRKVGIPEFARHKRLKLLYSKLSLFTKEMKKWHNIVFLDTDIIVRGSIDELSKVKGLHAVAGGFLYIKIDVKSDRNSFNLLKKKYDIHKREFNSGLLAFDTSIIDDGTFNNLIELQRRFDKLINDDQGLLNLFFYNKWNELPWYFNLWPFYFENIAKMNAEDIKGRILHFAGHDKPWNPNNSFYREWKTNLERAEDIDIAKRPEARPDDFDKETMMSVNPLQKVVIGMRWWWYRVNAIKRDHDASFFSTLKLMAERMWKR